MKTVAPDIADNYHYDFKEDHINGYLITYYIQIIMIIFLNNTNLPESLSILNNIIPLEGTKIQFLLGVH